MNGFTIAEQLEYHHGALQELIERFFAFLLSFSDSLADFFSDFTFDLIRTMLVFLVVLLAVSYAKTYLSAQSVRKYLLKLNRVTALLFATAAGFFSSTCVCTNIPIFLGFLSFGVPLSLCVTYLISSSLINIASVVSMWVLCGWKFTVCYIIASFVITYVAGVLLSLLPEEKYKMANFSGASVLCDSAAGRPTQKQRLHTAKNELVHIAKDQWLWILLGIALSAVIEHFADISFAEEISSFGFLGVLFATAVGVILHTDIIAVVPVLATLLELHISYGLLFSLTASLSFFAIPTIVMLKKALRVRYILYSWIILFFLILIAGAVMLPIYQ